ncbi:MAG: cadherin-like beta sandwich domain-containing protein [Lachnospiraceae bacterium]|nr:cadherin-like beta sandwich domain-containing protein [Lachnospiraceae bacterium]MDY5742136.1 cadherin-like beta sandwich domain-containing protein [Lachnospiraceae bacterium]
MIKKIKKPMAVMFVILALSGKLTAMADSAYYNAASNTVEGSLDTAGVWQIDFNNGTSMTNTDLINGETSFSVPVPSGATSATVTLFQLATGKHSSYQVTIQAPEPQPNTNPQPTPEPQPNTNPQPTPEPQPAPEPQPQQPTEEERQKQILENEKKKEEEARQKDAAIAALAGLAVDGGELSPGFDAAVTEYTVSVETVDRITVKTTKAVEGQTITGDGEIELNKKDRDVDITVTSADGTQSAVYRLHIKVKPEKEKTVSKTESAQNQKKEITAADQTTSKVNQAKAPEIKAPVQKKPVGWLAAIVISGVLIIAAGIGGYFFLSKKGAIDS